MNDLPHARDDAFDRHLRLRYWQAGTQLSAATQAQLQQRLRAADSQRLAPAKSHRLAWGLAAACSLTLLFGVRHLRQPPAVPGTARIATTAADSGELVATLDETPDLYLWVASDDAAAMTSE